MKTLATGLSVAMVLTLGLSSPAAAQPVCAPPPDKRVVVFYDKLAPYGTWFVCEPYGWVWQPYIVRIEPDWRPYCHGGRWLWVSGNWYWHSTYEWGWAVFHYGWWVRTLPHGWVWIPGLVWAPAWVEWREFYPYRAWAPLPPRCLPRSGVTLSFGSVEEDGLSWNVTITTEDFLCVHQDAFCSVEPWRVAQPLHRVVPARHCEPPPAPPCPPHEPLRVEYSTGSRRSEAIHSIVRQSSGTPSPTRTEPRIAGFDSSSRVGSVERIVRTQAVTTSSARSSGSPSPTPADRQDANSATSRRLERVRAIMRNEF